MAKLTPQEELKLQQLQQTRFWEEHKQALKTEPIVDTMPKLPLTWGDKNKWMLTQGITLHNWQQQSIEAWFKNKGQGVIKVVTGAGKTILALGITEKLQQTTLPQLRVAVVVPTIVLLQQWYDEITTHSNLPPNAIGLMGGGHDDSFSERTRILICVLNSASKKLAGEVERAGVSDKLLLIVDECHRAGASEMQRIFRTKRAYSLGLSATPERDDDENEESDAEDSFLKDKTLRPFEDTVIGRELGNVVFEMNYANAIKLGVLPPFSIVHYGLNLRQPERAEYEQISRTIKDLRSELETPNRRGLALIRWCRSKAAANNFQAAQLIALTTKRKRLLYRMEERSAAVLAILRQAFDQNHDTKVILFHESIDEVMGLFSLLRDKGYAIVAEHSKFPDQMRAQSLRLFRNGTARIIVSARSLIEGFNVPSADIGIIVAASSSVRQRVQTLGRLLRKSRRIDGSEKEAILYVLYAADTVDELIYEKADWEQFVGAERNEYFLWSDVAKSEPMLCQNPPRIPIPDEADVDLHLLRPGEPYPGNPDQGQLYTIDTQGMVRGESGVLTKPNVQLHSILSIHKKGGGRFRITPVNRFVTKLQKTRDGWESIYLGRLEVPLKPVESDTDVGLSIKEYAPGEVYPLGKAKGKTFSILPRDKRLIAQKSSTEIRFVIPAEQIKEPEKQTALRQIQQHLFDTYAKGHRISKIIVTREGHVVYLFNGQAFFLGYAPEGEKGFIFEGFTDKEGKHASRSSDSPSPSKLPRS